MVSEAEVAHEKENTMEYALVGETEHRSDEAQEHRMEVHLDYALDTGSPVCEHSSDGEVSTIPNTLKEAMESPQQPSGKKPQTRRLTASRNTHSSIWYLQTQYHRSKRWSGPNYFLR